MIKNLTLQNSTFCHKSKLSLKSFYTNKQAEKHANFRHSSLLKKTYQLGQYKKAVYKLAR